MTRMGDGEKSTRSSDQSTWRRLWLPALLCLLLLCFELAALLGDFSKGEVVSLVDPGGFEFARGLTNFGAHDARRIAGKRTEQIAEILGSLPYDEVIHCDNLVVTA